MQKSTLWEVLRLLFFLGLDVASRRKELVEVPTFAPKSDDLHHWMGVVQNVVYRPKSVVLKKDTKKT